MSRTHGSGDDIVVAFGIDEQYARHLAVVITSIVRTAPDERFRFLVLHGGVSDDTRQNVQHCAPKHNFEWHKVTDSRLLTLKGRGHVSQASYYRLCLPDVAPASIHRLIYLDSDLVVCKSLRQLWQSDLKGHAIGAVFDASVDPTAFALQHSLPNRRLGYFNAGVLMLDVATIRRESLFLPAIEFLSTCATEPKYHDQDALNLAFWDKWTCLDPMWNTQRGFLLRHSNPCFPEDSDMPKDRRPKILHFTTEWKPWRPGSSHPYMWAYFASAKRTTYWNLILKDSNASLSMLLKWRLKHAWYSISPSSAFEPHHRMIANHHAADKISN